MRSLYFAKQMSPQLAEHTLAQNYWKGFVITAIVTFHMARHRLEAYISLSDGYDADGALSPAHPIRALNQASTDLDQTSFGGLLPYPEKIGGVHQRTGACHMASDEVFS